MIEYPPPPFFFIKRLLAVFTSIKNQLEIFTKTLLNYYNALKYALKIYI